MKKDWTWWFTSNSGYARCFRTGLLLGFFLGGLAVRAGTASATTVIPIGMCQNFTLLNATDNTSYSGSICAGTANILLAFQLSNSTPTFSFNNSTSNISIFAEGNFSVVQNTTVFACNASNLTLWANSTATQNNLSIACLSNTSIIVDTLRRCDYLANYTPSPQFQYYRNDAANLTILIQPVAAEFCYENRHENATAPKFWRSDRGNNTFICEPAPPVVRIVNVSENLTCVSEAAIRYPLEVQLNSTIKIYNESIWGEGGYETRLSGLAVLKGCSDGTLLGHCSTAYSGSRCMSIEGNASLTADPSCNAATNQQQIEAATRPVYDGMLLFALGIGAAYLYAQNRARTEPVAAAYPKPLSQERIDALEKKLQEEDEKTTQPR